MVPSYSATMSQSRTGIPLTFLRPSNRELKIRNESWRGKERVSSGDACETKAVLTIKMLS